MKTFINSLEVVGQDLTEKTEKGDKRWTGAKLHTTCDNKCYRKKANLVEQALCGGHISSSHVGYTIRMNLNQEKLAEICYVLQGYRKERCIKTDEKGHRTKTV